MGLQIITNIDSSLGPTTLNCNPNLVHVQIPYHDPAWFDFRYQGIQEIYEGGIGASECSLLMGVDPEDYRPVLPELLQWKAGINIPERRINKGMLRGIKMEPIILDYWTLYDGTDYGYLDKYLANEKMRSFGLIHAYIYNKRFHHLFASLDAKILAGQPNLLTGSIIPLECPLECKSIGFWASKAKKHALPLKYVYQGQQQMLVTETEYMEFAVFDFNDNFTVIGVEIDPYICEQIIERSYKAWNTVKQLRVLKSEKETLMQSGQWGLAEKIEAEMQNLLPLPGEGEAYKEYHSESYLKTSDRIKGTLQQYEWIKKRADLNALIKLYTYEAGKIDNLFSDSFVKNQCEYIDFDTLGKVRYFKKANGKNSQLDFKGVKHKPDHELITEIYHKQMELITHWEN
ncbi:MAG TPA: YqaJ viral recombinase family protein [Saprospiraceae bacterium]|nr:YqaJ viral recombinase family protein [Saprospiraceae bacterium]